MVQHFGIKDKDVIERGMKADPGFLPVGIDTVCSGTESVIYSAYQMFPKRALVHGLSCDKDKASAKFIQQNFEPEKFMKTVEDVLHSLRAKGSQNPLHRTVQTSVGPVRFKIVGKMLLVGFPCFPYSTLSSQRYAEDGGFANEESIIYFTISNIIDTKEYDVVVLKNVAGMGMRSPQAEMRCVEVVDRDLKAKVAYWVNRFCLQAELVRSRRRYWWSLVRRTRATKDEIDALNKTIDQHILPPCELDDFTEETDSDIVSEMLEGYAPTRQRYKLLHADMECTTADRHRRIRQLLGIPARTGPGGQVYSRSLPKKITKALCARERDLLDVLHLCEFLTEAEWEEAKKRVRLASRTWSKLASSLPATMRRGTSGGVLVELGSSLERFPFYSEPQCLNRNSKTFDTKLKRPIAAKENWKASGWSMTNINTAGIGENHLKSLIGLSMEVPSVSKFVAAHMMLLQPRFAKSA